MKFSERIEATADYIAGLAEIAKVYETILNNPNASIHIAVDDEECEILPQSALYGQIVESIKDTYDGIEDDIFETSPSDFINVVEETL